MGDTISSLVFRPPKPTHIHPSEYFYLDVDVHTPLCTNAPHRGRTAEGCIGDDHGGCLGGGLCADAPEPQGEDAATDRDCRVIGARNSWDHRGEEATASPVRVNNVRGGQEYKIPAFFIRRRNATQTLLFSHGNAEDLGMMYGRMKDLAMVLGVNVMAYDYTGYGLSVPGPAHPGTAAIKEGPSEEMIYRNVTAAFRYLTEVRRIPPRRIVLYGRSLGSGPSCYLAAKSALDGASVGGLVLHSPFLSVYKVVADLNGLDLGLVGDLFPNERRARNVRCPTLVIHGRQDEVVPFWHAPRLLAAVPPEFRAVPYYAEGMGHNHIEGRRREDYVRAVSRFLRLGAATTDGAGGPRAREGDRGLGPCPVPEHARAGPGEAKENAAFYVNKTWLRHAKVLLKEVFADAGCYVPRACGEAPPGGGGRDPRRRPGHRRTRSCGRGDGAVARPADARDDDEEDEFAPWREAPDRRSRSATASPAPDAAGADKILTTRYGDRNAQPDGRATSSYRKAQTATSPMDRNDGPALSPRYAARKPAPYSHAQSMPMQLSEGMRRQQRF